MSSSSAKVFVCMVYTYYYFAYIFYVEFSQFPQKILIFLFSFLFSFVSSKTWFWRRLKNRTCNWKRRNFEYRNAFIQFNLYNFRILKSPLNCMQMFVVNKNGISNTTKLKKIIYRQLWHNWLNYRKWNAQ